MGSAIFSKGKNGIHAVYPHFAVFQRQEEKTFGPLMRKNALSPFPASDDMPTMLTNMLTRPEEMIRMVVHEASNFRARPYEEFPRGLAACCSECPSRPGRPEVL